MKRSLLAALLLILPFVAGCGASPEDAGKAYAKSVIKSLESGDPAALQKVAEDAAAKAKGMSASDAAEFMKGYNEVATPYIQSKMQNMQLPNIPMPNLPTPNVPMPAMPNIPVQK